MTLVVQAVVVFTANLYIKYTFMFLLGLVYFKNIQAVLLATEIVIMKHKIYVTTFILSLNSMALPVTAAYFKFISSDWRYIFYTYFVLS